MNTVQYESASSTVCSIITNEEEYGDQTQRSAQPPSPQNNELLNCLVAIVLQLSFAPPVIECYECMTVHTISASTINLKYISDVPSANQHLLYVVVGKATGHRGGQR